MRRFSHVCAIGTSPQPLRKQCCFFISSFFGSVKSFSARNSVCDKGGNVSNLSNHNNQQEGGLSEAPIPYDDLIGGDGSGTRNVHRTPSPRFSPAHAAPFSTSTSASSSSVSSSTHITPMSPEVCATSSSAAASFPRSVDEAKGAFVGNFPAQGAKLDETHFYNKVPFLRPGASLAEASEFMCVYDVGCVPILDFVVEDVAKGETITTNNRKKRAVVIGMLSERDLARWLAKAPKPSLSSSNSSATHIGEKENSKEKEQHEKNGEEVSFSPHSVRVEEVMSRNVIFCSDETTLDEALALMDKHNFRHLPVMSSSSAAGAMKSTGSAKRAAGTNPQMMGSGGNDLSRRELVGLLSMRDVMHQHVRGKGKGHVDDFMSWVLKMSS